MDIQFRAILTPCTGVCALDDEGICMGCHRTTDEITRWGQMDDGERAQLMDSVLPEREARRP